MTATVTRRKASRKPLRIRPEFLPDSARYITIDDCDYVMIPVADFAGWHEDLEDRAVAEDARDDPAPGIPFDEMMRRIRRNGKGGKA